MVDIRSKLKLHIDPEKQVREKEGGKPQDGLCITTVGRVVFNEPLPVELPFNSYPLDHSSLMNIIQDCQASKKLTEHCEAVI